MKSWCYPARYSRLLLILLPWITSCFTVPILAQTCLTDGIIFHTQIEIDNFPINYPGCSQILGNVTIDETSPGNIGNLNGLSGITTIDGTLTILNNSNLTSLTGLDNLTSIGKVLKIENNDALISLNSLGNLTSVGINLEITLNDGLGNLSGLNNITSVGGNMRIYDNDALASLSALVALESIGGYLQILHDSALVRIGMIALENIGGELYLQHNPLLAELDLDGLTYVGENVTVGSLPLPDLEGLNALDTIGGFLRITNNGNMTDLNGLNNLLYIGDYLDITNNAALNNISGLNGLTSIPGYLTIYFNPSLDSLDGLENVISIGGSMQIQYNSITDMHDFNNLTSIDGYLELANNDALSDIQDLGNVTSINGGLYIWNNDALNSLSGLDNINHTSITDLLIQNSTVLSICEVSSICDYLENGGTANISGNAPGCNSTEEVQTACSTSSGYTVNNTGDSGPGSLRDAIENITPGDTIFFAAGMTDDTISLDSALIIDLDLTILTGPGQNISIDGSGINNTVSISGGASVEIIGITIFGGNGPNGVVWNQGSLILDNVQIAGDGSTGVIFLNDGELEMKNGSTISKTPAI